MLFYTRHHLAMNILVIHSLTTHTSDENGTGIEVITSADKSLHPPTTILCFHPNLTEVSVIGQSTTNPVPGT